jgi:hypothetical protein
MAQHASPVWVNCLGFDQSWGSIRDKINTQANHHKIQMNKTNSQQESQLVAFFKANLLTTDTSIRSDQIK